MEESQALITNDAVVFGLLMALLAFVFKTSSSNHPWLKKFYGIVPMLLLCYFLPSLLNTFNIVDEVAFFDCEDYGYSPDGLVGKHGLVEFKCPGATTHTKYLFEDRLPVEYKAQCQGGLMVTGRRYIDFVSYHPNFQDDKKLFIKKVTRDEEFIKKLKEGIGKVIELRDQFIIKIKG